MTLKSVVTRSLSLSTNMGMVPPNGPESSFAQEDYFVDYEPEVPDEDYYPWGCLDEVELRYWPEEDETSEEDDSAEMESCDEHEGDVQSPGNSRGTAFSGDAEHENQEWDEPLVLVVDHPPLGYTSWYSWMKGERPGVDYDSAGAEDDDYVGDEHDVVSQLSGSHGEWTQSDDVKNNNNNNHNKQDVNDARKRAKKEAETNKHRAGAQHKAKKGEKEPIKAKPECKFFLKGKCKHGDKCRFDHPAPAPVAPSAVGQKPYMAVLASRNGHDSDDEEDEGEDEKMSEVEHKADAPAPRKPKDKPKKEVEKLTPAQWEQKIRTAKVLIKNDPKGPRRFRFAVSAGESFESMILKNFRMARLHPVKVDQKFFSGHKSTLEWLDTMYALWRDEGRLPWVEEDDPYMPENPFPDPDAFGGLAGAYGRLVDHAASKIQKWFKDHAKPVVIQLMQEQVNPQLGCCSPLAGALHYVAKRVRESIFFLRPPPPSELVFDPVESIGTHKLYGAPLTTAYRHRFGNEISLQVDSGYTAIVNVKTRKKYLKHALKELTPLLLTEHTRRMGIQSLLEKYEPMLARHSDHSGAVREVQYMKNAVNWVCQFLETKEVEDFSRTSRRTKKALPVVDFR